MTPVNPEPLPMKMPVVVPPRAMLGASRVPVTLAAGKLAAGDGSGYRACGNGDAGEARAVTYEGTGEKTAGGAAKNASGGSGQHEVGCQLRPRDAGDRKLAAGDGPRDGACRDDEPVRFEPSPLKMPVVVPPRRRFDAQLSAGHARHGKLAARDGPGHGTCRDMTPVKFEPSPLKMPVVVPPRARSAASCEPVMLAGASCVAAMEPVTELAGTVTPVNPEPFPLKVPVKSPLEVPLKMPVVVPASTRLDANWVPVTLAVASWLPGTVPVTEVAGTVTPVRPEPSPIKAPVKMPAGRAAPAPGCLPVESRSRSPRQAGCQGWSR